MKYACNTCRVNTLFVQSNLKCVVQTSKMCGRPFFFYFFSTPTFNLEPSIQVFLKFFNTPKSIFKVQRRVWESFSKKKCFSKIKKKKRLTAILQQPNIHKVGFIQDIKRQDCRTTPQGKKEQLAWKNWSWFKPFNEAMSKLWKSWSLVFESQTNHFLAVQMEVRELKILWLPNGSRCSSTDLKFQSISFGSIINLV